MLLPVTNPSPAGGGENLRQPRRAFTLIEILVVVAIIAILVGILLAIGSGVLRRSTENVTKNTLKILDSAMSLYLKEHPEPTVNATSPNNSLLGNDWVIRLYAYPDTAKILDGLKPVNTGAARKILDGFGGTIYYLPSNLDMVATVDPTNPQYNPALHTPGRFVSFGFDGKPDSKALGGSGTSAATDDLFSEGAAVQP